MIVILILIASGGHLNPAVTLGVFIAGGINVLAVVLYWIAQIIGAVLGALCILVCLVYQLTWLRSS